MERRTLLKRRVIEGIYLENYLQISCYALQSTFTNFKKPLEKELYFIPH
jgi:hypothetical protein